MRHRTSAVDHDCSVRGPRGLPRARYLDGRWLRRHQCPGTAGPASVFPLGVESQLRIEERRTEGQRCEEGAQKKPGGGDGRAATVDLAEAVDKPQFPEPRDAADTGADDSFLRYVLFAE